MSGDLATYGCTVRMNSCSLALLLAGIDQRVFLRRPLLVEEHDLYRVRRMALPLGTCGREEVGLPWSLCWTVGG